MPCAPAGPATPCAPVGPAGPVNPCMPWGPVTPVGPLGPAGPAGPDTLRSLRTDGALRIEERPVVGICARRNVIPPLVFFVTYGCVDGHGPFPHTP
jgi:hypothetical protein